jgi:hypothetical protein
MGDFSEKTTDLHGLFEDPDTLVEMLEAALVVVKADPACITKAKLLEALNFLGNDMWKTIMEYEAIVARRQA